MPPIGYPSECPYIDHPPRESGGVDDLDKQLRDCLVMIHQWPPAISSVVRHYWGEDKSERWLAYKFGVTRKRIRAILGTVHHLVIKECINPYTIRAV